MGKDEQRETLEKITSNKINVEKQLQSLPLRIETPSLLKRKTEYIHFQKKILIVV